VIDIGTGSSELIEVEGASVTFQRARGSTKVRAVRDVDLVLRRGETVGLVGESGSGKSTLARAILGTRPLVSGTIRFDGVSLTSMDRRQRKALRSRLQVVFQDPYSSLDPRLKIGTSIGEPLRTHTTLSRTARSNRVAELLTLVGLRPDMADRFPHEFSGGQRQRIAVARALALKPDILICDEPTSALDVSIQAQILNLLMDLRHDLSLTCLFIAHDLAVVRRMVDRVAVMYQGRIVEEGSRDDVYDRPAHPYTAALLSAVPNPAAPDRLDRRRIRLPEVEDLEDDASTGCPFAPRCWLHVALGHPADCLTNVPQRRRLGSRQEAACHFAEHTSELRHEATP
jgi:oligopeptide/dipeptide ABC transporter ATP-binding protein